MELSPQASAEQLVKAMALKPTDNGLSALMLSDFSNAPPLLPPESGFPFGGLLASLCAKSMRTALDIEAPLQTLTVQYLAAARYGEELLFMPRMLRAGRQVTFASVEAHQGRRMTHHASATYGDRAPDAYRLKDRAKVPPSRDSIPDINGMTGPRAPRFAAHVDYRFDGGPNIMGGNAERARTERCWMRMRGGQPLDELTLCYLLDALYPPSWTGFKKPPAMTTIDLRYDFVTAPDTNNTPDGWAYFEFNLIDHDEGWALDEATAWGVDGSVLATARQRRKVISKP